MSNYVKATNFAEKDGFSSGDTRKLVRGTEINAEFDAIASAVSTKADTASPTFTGTAQLTSGTLNLSSSTLNVSNGTLVLTGSTVTDGTIDCGTY